MKNIEPFKSITAKPESLLCTSETKGWYSLTPLLLVEERAVVTDILVASYYHYYHYAQKTAPAPQHPAEGAMRMMHALEKTNLTASQGILSSSPPPICMLPKSLD